MEPITATAVVAGFQLAKSAIKAARDALDTAEDVKTIGHVLDNVFRAHGEANREFSQSEKKELKPPTKLQKFLGKDGEDASDEDSLGSIVESRLAKQAYERQLMKLRFAVDRKLGTGVFDSCVNEYNRRQKAKAAAEVLAKENALKQAKKDRERFHYLLMEALKLATVLVVVVVVGGVLIFAAQKGGSL